MGAFRSVLLVAGGNDADSESVEAAHFTWRPLGRLLVDQGLLTADELEHALARQKQTGKRLGETIVECGFVSGPELASTASSTNAKPARSAASGGRVRSRSALGRVSSR